ncbi:GrpE protein 2 [Ranunculus cassubicifolius]
MFARTLSRISRKGFTNILLHSPKPKLTPNNFHSLRESTPIQWILCQVTSLHHSSLSTNGAHRLWYSSTPEPTNKENEEQNVADDVKENGKVPKDNGEKESSKDNREKESSSSDSDIEGGDLSFDDLVKLVAEKEELLKVKHREIEHMQDKVLRSYADMENIMDRTKREAENSKKFAIQTFAKSLLDVSDNLGRASSVVKESFSKIDTSKDDTGAVQLLKTLLEGVEMTEKQLAEVFKKFGLEKYDPLNEQFDPNKHFALFQVPDASKPPGTVAAVLKAGYMLHDRIIRPAEVGVTTAVDAEASS